LDFEIKIRERARISFFLLKIQLNTYYVIY
jgi:hypothetical protein